MVSPQCVSTCVLLELQLEWPNICTVCTCAVSPQCEWGNGSLNDYFGWRICCIANNCTPWLCCGFAYVAKDHFYLQTSLNNCHKISELSFLMNGTLSLPFWLVTELGNLTYMHFYFQSLLNLMASQLSLFIISTSNVLNSHPNLKANLTASRSSKVIVPIICIVAYIYLWTGLHYGRNMPNFLPCHFFFQWTSMKRLPTHVLWSNLTHRSPLPPKQLFQSTQCIIN